LICVFGNGTNYMMSKRQPQQTNTERGRKKESLKAEKIKTYPYVVEHQQRELVGQLQEDQHVVEHHRQLIMMNYCQRDETMIEK